MEMSRSPKGPIAFYPARTDAQPLTLHVQQEGAVHIPPPVLHEHPSCSPLRRVLDLAEYEEVMNGRLAKLLLDNLFRLASDSLLQVVSTVPDRCSRPAMSDGECLGGRAVDHSHGGLEMELLTQYLEHSGEGTVLESHRDEERERDALACGEVLGENGCEVELVRLATGQEGSIVRGINAHDIGLQFLNEFLLPRRQEDEDEGDILARQHVLHNRSHFEQIVSPNLEGSQDIRVPPCSRGCLL